MAVSVYLIHPFMLCGCGYVVQFTAVVFSSVGDTKKNVKPKRENQNEGWKKGEMKKTLFASFDSPKSNSGLIIYFDTLFWCESQVQDIWMMAVCGCVEWFGLRLGMKTLWFIWCAMMASRERKCVVNECEHVRGELRLASIWMHLKWFKRKFSTVNELRITDGLF